VITARWVDLGAWVFLGAVVVAATCLPGCAWFRANPEVVPAAADALGARAEIVCSAVPNARDRAACVLAVRVASALAADAARLAAEAAVEGQACPAPSGSAEP